MASVQIGHKMVLILLTIVFVSVACAGESETSSPDGPTDGGVAIEDAAPVPGESSSSAAPPAPESTDTTGADQADEIPSGAVVLFYRVSFGTETERLRVPGGDIAWESGSKGIARYVPSTGQVDVIRTIASPSYAKSAIYPVTFGGRLFAVRDWGADWTSENKQFSIEELDPRNDASMSSTDIHAEWFTISGNKVYFKSEVRKDLFGNVSGGGIVMAKNLGSADERELPVQESFVAVGDQLASLVGSTVRVHDRSTGEPQASTELAPALTDNIWPTVRNVFYVDDAIYWAEATGGVKYMGIVRVSLTGAVERLATLRVEADETSLVIDQGGGRIVVGTVSSMPPRGIGIKRLFLLDIDEKKLDEVPINQHIPLARNEAGGGVQILVMP